MFTSNIRMWSEGLWPEHRCRSNLWFSFLTGAETCSVVAFQPHGVTCWGAFLLKAERLFQLTFAPQLHRNGLVFFVCFFSVQSVVGKDLRSISQYLKFRNCLQNQHHALSHRDRRDVSLILMSDVYIQFWSSDWTIEQVFLLKWINKESKYISLRFTVQTMSILIKMTNCYPWQSKSIFH